MGLFDNNKKKSNEMTLPLLSSIADVVTSVGSGYAQGFEKAIDAGASLASWYARLAGMDNAERKINEFIAKDLIGDGSRMADYFEQRGSVLGDKARNVLSTGGSFLNPGTFFPTGLGAQPTYLETREALQEEQPEYMRRWKQMISPLTSTTDDIKAQLGVGAAKSVEGILDAGATAAAWGARIFGADRAEKAITNWIADDHIGDGSEYADYYTKKGSILGDGAGGEIVRGISQGVGQMLPSVAAAIITGGGSVAGMTALGLSAGGGGVEEALSEGAGLGRATLYGAAVAGTELATEKLVGGPMAKAFGGGWLDDVTGSVLKTGWGRVAKEAVGEGVEEGLAELASPLLKSIYKGVDAFSEYGDKDYWKGVGESALIGAGTSVAFGGTVGRAMGTSGKAADVASIADDISSNAKRRMELYREGKITEGDENDRRTSRTMLADYQKLQEILQKTDANERSRLIKANNLGGVVDENGTVRPSVLASLTIEDTDSQTPTGEQNAPQGKKTPLSGAYISPGLWRQSEKVQSDLAGISDDLRANGKEGKPVELFRGELSEAAQENYNAFKRAASKLSLQSDNKLQFALIDAPSSVSGVHRGGTVYLNTKTLEDGKWARVLFEEATHFTDGTAEAADFKAFLEKEDGLFEDVAEGLLAQGNAYGFTDENVMGEKSETFNREMYAQMASRVLTSPEYVDKLVRADRTLAEKIKNRISDVAETLRSVTSKDIEIRKQLRQATKAQGLFERALGAGEAAEGRAEYRLAENAAQELHKALYDKKYSNEVLLRDKTPSILIGHEGVKDLPMVMKATHIRENVFTEEEAKNLGLKVDEHTHYHGLGEDFFLNVIDGLDNVTEAYRGTKNAENSARRENYFLLISKFTDKSGNEVNVPVYINERANYNDVMIDTNKISTAFGRDGLREYISREVQKKNLVRVKNKNIQTSEPNADIASRYGKDALDNSIPQNPKMSTPKSDFSMENVSEEADRSADVANQQASGDLEFGAEDIFPGWGEERISKQEQTRDATESTEAAKQDEREEKKAQRLPGKVTYENVNDMLNQIREQHLTFDVDGKKIHGYIKRKDGWRLSKDIYNYLRENEQASAGETSTAIARMILKYTKTYVWKTYENEDGTTTRGKEEKPIGNFIKKQRQKHVSRLANEISTLRGKYENQKEAKVQMKAVKAEAREKLKESNSRNKLLSNLDFDLKKVADMKKGRYVNASKLKNDSFTTAINELSKMNWKGGLVSDKKIREHFAQISAWYSPKNALYGHDGNPNERYRQDIKDALSELGDTSAGALSNDDLRMADEVVKYFRNEIDTYGTIFKNGKREDAQTHVENYVAKIELSNQIVSRSSNIIKILRSNFARQFADPAMLMRLADSYVEGGFFTEQFEEMRQGAISAAVLERELLSRFESFWSGAAGKAYSKRYNDTEIELRGRKMPIAEAISLYMTLKRDHTIAGAAYAGFEIEGKEKTINVSDGFAEIVEACRADILSKLSAEEQLTLDKDDHAVIEQQALREAADRVMKELDASFTEKDRELISITEEIMEKCRDYKVAVDEILQGASNVTGGYYYPVKRTGLAENVDTMSMFEGDRVSNLSINKETVKNAHKLLIEPVHVVLMRHVKAISLYHGLGVFTDNFNRLYNLNISENANNPTTIRTSLGRASRFAKEMVSYFKEMKQDVEGISKNRTAEKWYNDSVLAIRSAYATYQLGFNLKTGFTQLSSVAASTSMLDPDALAKGIAVKNKGDVDEYCRLAWLRNNDGAAILAQTVTTGMNAVQKQGRGALQKVRDASMWHIGKMDRVVIQTLWGASQVQIEKDGGAKVGTEANKKAAGKLLERVILETQQNSLATERSAAMRSSDQILKALTMFRSDAMKLGARWLDAVGKWYSVNAQIRIANDRLDGGDAKAGADIKRLQSEKKTAAKACARVTGAVMSTALFSAALSVLWKWLMDRDDEENGWTFFFDVLGNLIGGVPVFSDIYSFFVDGFEVENFIFDTVNNVLGAIRGTAAMTVDAINGKEVSKQDVLNNLKKLAFALGQGSGISTRNIYNFITGIISRVSPEAGIWIEMQFSSRSVAGDLKKAMEDGDDQMVDTIVGIMLDQDGGEMNEGTRRATAKLIKSGYEGILPRSIPETLTNAQDVEVELTKKQRQQFEKVYSAAYRAADDLVRMGYFKAASKDEQAYALKFIWSTYYALAKDTVLGEDSTKKNVLFAEAIPVERLALIVAQASAIKADVDKNGKAINGSRMHKIEAMIESLHLSAAQKYMMMGYLGYTNKKGREIVERYIRTLGLSRAEQAELLEMSGYREK